MFLKSTPNGWVTSGNMFSVLKFVCFLLTFYYLLVSILNSQYCTVLKFVFTFTTYYYFLHFNTMLSAQYPKFTDLSRLYTSYVLLSMRYSHLSGLLHHLIITLPCSFHVTSSYLLLLAPYFLLVELKNKMPFLKIMFEIILAFISD